MAIYIKGIDMPKTCEECFHVDFCTGRYWEITEDDMGYMGKYVKDNCPLIEVPEPHGRLVDADALADDLEADGKEFGDEMKLNCASWLRSNAIPTIIEGSNNE